MPPRKQATDLRVHRLKVESQALGWTPPPGPLDVKVRRGSPGWSVSVTCPAKWADSAAGWLLDQGAVAVDRGTPRGAASLVKGRFQHLSPNLEAVLGQARIEHIALFPDGSVLLVVRTGDDEAIRIRQRLGAAQAVEARASLTDRQTELLDYCVARGYYGIPRRATLRTLGKELGISTTSLSLALRRAEGKIILAFEAQRRAADDRRLPEVPFQAVLAEALRPLADPLEIQETAAHLLANHLHADLACYAERDGEAIVVERQGRSAGSTLEARGRHPVDGPFGSLSRLQHGEILVVADTRATPRPGGKGPAPSSRKTGEVGAILAMPIVKGARVVGALCVVHGTPRPWTARDVETLEETADRTWAAVERARAEALVRAGERRRAFLARVAEALRAAADDEAIGLAACRLLAQELDADRAFFGRVHPERGVAEIPAEYRRPALRSLEGGYPLAAFPGLSRRLGREPLVVSDLEADGDVTAEERRTIAGLDVSSFVIVPVHQEGRLVWSLAVMASKARAWTAQEVALVAEMADLAWHATERAHAQRMLRRNDGRYRAIFDMIEEAVQECEVVRDSSGKAVDLRILRVNPAWQRIMDVDAKRVVGKLVSQWRDLDLDRLADIDRILAAGRPTRHEDPLVPLGRWFDVFFVPVDRDRYFALFTETTQHHPALPAPKARRTTP